MDLDWGTDLPVPKKQRTVERRRGEMQKIGAVTIKPRWVERSENEMVGIEKGIWAGRTGEMSDRGRKPKAQTKAILSVEVAANAGKAFIRATSNS